MWFRNLQIYRLRENDQVDIDTIESAFAKSPLYACGPQDAECVGWVPPKGTGSYVHAVNRQWLIALGVEQKLMPSSVVRQVAADRAKAIEEAEGRRVGRGELRSLREALATELLPRAFSRRRTTCAWIDPVNGWFVVDSGSQSSAEELLEHLRKTIEGVPVALLKTVQSPTSAMTGWMAGNEAPAGFSIDQDSELRSAEQAIVRYARHSLEGKDIREHIVCGKVVTRLGLTWNDRISFVLDEKLQVKRLAFLDILKEETDGQADNEDERFDLDFALMTGELARMLADLVAALGGEPEREA